MIKENGEYQMIKLKSQKEKMQNKELKTALTKKLNGWFKASIAILIILSVLASVFIIALHYTYKNLNIAPISAFVKYSDWYKPIDDDTYLNSSNTVVSRDNPVFAMNGKTVYMDAKGNDNPALYYIYTGDEKFVYSSGDLWDKLVQIGRKYPKINTQKGFVRLGEEDSFQMTADGWYTVIGVWYENGVRYEMNDNFNRKYQNANAMNGETVKAYERWKSNKDNIRSSNGIKNYLLVGADEWTRKTEDEIFSDTVILATVNHTKKTVTFSSILKEAYVYIPGVGAGRLTDAYNCGGIELLIKTVSENFGVKIDNYSLFDYKFFISFVDALGGLDIKLDQKQIKNTNSYINYLYEQYDLKGSPKDHYIDNSDKKLDGIQALSYLRHYYEGDFPRAERYKQCLKEMALKIQVNDLPFLVKNIYPYITTDFSYKEYRDLLFDSVLLLKYDTNYNSYPSTNRLADFKENGKYNVLLLNDGEVQNVNKVCKTTGKFDPNPKSFYDKLKMYFFIAIAVIVLVMIYLAFIHKYKVVYIVSGKRYTKKRRYRFGQKAHIYHFDLPVKVKGLYADADMMLEFGEVYKMPMHSLYVYVKATDESRETEGNETVTG